MPNIPFFTSESEYCLRRSDLDFWCPYIHIVLGRHHFSEGDKRETATCGFNPTYPVFLIDDIVIKFFGYRLNWLTAFNNECNAHEYLKKDSSILAPLILAKGKLFPNSDSWWPYIISTKVAGRSWLDSNLSDSEKNNVAAEIGAQLRKIHAIPIDQKLQFNHKFSTLNVKLAAEKSILPKHLVNQVESFMIKLDEFDPCFVNGDIVDTHIFIENDHLTGLIDWGDATVTDRHYELGKLMDTFDWDKKLLKTALESSHWPAKKNFAKQSLGLALYRQAVGLTQHDTFDVFYKLPTLFPLEEIKTLDELADILFNVF